ncbi:hypothetical protein C4D60_Mb05t13050 [Musa balbisiana]|uniref:Uncharacterized protein n=1 Tax=Musa balbisiana TaxID=52838 RepID=A0A4S8JVR2_MUSBA|nr:hypothetical protein C4D60_Mb05t13050 [Musa balbisiana]
MVTVLVEEGKFTVDFGRRAQASSSSPQKSPGLNVIELKKPVRPPSDRTYITKQQVRSLNKILTGPEDNKRKLG